jgi:hypothetical protein
MMGQGYVDRGLLLVKLRVVRVNRVND